MNFNDLRQEVLNHGFDPIQYTARINQYLNDAQNLIARRVDYYEDDGQDVFSTVAGTELYSWPANFARMRSIFDTNRHVEMEYVSVRDIDRSGVSNGAPTYYALTGQSVRLYPIPDNIYPMEMRYWALPAAMVNDGDLPSVPNDWAHILWVYATWMCYEADDDSQMGQYWQQRFNAELSMFGADQKFPSADGPTQANGMWDRERTLGPANQWTLYGAGW